MSICGQIIAGQLGKILIREKSGQKIELGDLLVVEDDRGLALIQIHNLYYGSQISQLARELISGVKLEGRGGGLQFLEPQLRNYVIAEGKTVLRISDNISVPKILPDFFNTVRYTTKQDLEFLSVPENPVYMGKIRSGSKIIDIDVYLDGLDAFTHHILIPSTTGRGKSNLVKVMLCSILGQDRFGMLVLDPHDEYYGRSGKGLKDHPKSRQGIRYYSTNPLPGTNTLIINLNSIEPEHFEGILSFTIAQQHAIRLYKSEYGDRWIESIVRGKGVKGVNKVTLSVLQRIIRTSLSIYFDGEEVICENRVFSNSAGEATIHDMVHSIEEGKIVVIDTSKVGDEAELLIGSIIANAILAKYQRYKSEGGLTEKVPVSIVIEEAPRVLGSNKLADLGDNIYSRIAREGRKFKVGLLAITQLASVIPRQVLTNMNTKIILGNEMAPERRALMDSAAQDLSDDDRNIASLDRGEAIVSSIFTKFAVPIKIPLFKDYLENCVQSVNDRPQTVFIG
ncbi:MAG: ATP-binding protein [Candidatus Bathyarchaeota archaeon]|nr:MAG: ATP-binding protein [Candidatus Bathyarchaeota archaeon]